MNISKIQTYNLIRPFPRKQNMPVTNFGIKMNQPLSNDVFSFRANSTGTVKSAIKEGVRSNKKRGKEFITTQLAKQLRKSVALAHEQNVELFRNTFKDILSKLDESKNIVERNVLTFVDRIKGEYSIIQKASSIAEDENIPIKKLSKKSLLKNIKDISGIEIILEKPAKNLKSNYTPNDDAPMKEVTKRFSEMMKNHDVLPEEIEYHRFAPEYKKGKVVKRFDTMNPELVRKIMQTAQDSTNNNCKCTTVDSPIGYSALHITLKNPDDTYTEFKIIARAIANIQDVENMLYKVQNNKAVAPEYKAVGEYLSQLKPLDDYASKEEQEIHEKVEKVLKEYKKDMYRIGLENPLEDIQDFPQPKNPIIKQYGFNIIKDKMQKSKQAYKKQ